MIKTPLLTVLALLVVGTFAFAQKQTTVMGDAWRGVVESSNEATREIRIVNENKKTESFTGVLEQGYQVKLKDGTSRELLISELKPGLRLRVFYKSKTIAGTKVNLINRLQFLGRDEHTQVREMLKIAPATPVLLEESSKLPQKDPLKLHLAIEPKKLTEGLAKWAEWWNKEESAKHGRVEIVDDPAQADVSFVVFWGGEDYAAPIPVFQAGFNGGEMNYITIATVYLARKDDAGLHVFMHRKTMLPLKNPEVAAQSFGKEFEKRLKARSR